MLVSWIVGCGTVWEQLLKASVLVPLPLSQPTPFSPSLCEEGDRQRREKKETKYISLKI